MLRKFFQLRGALARLGGEAPRGRQGGQGLVEYALILVLVAIVVIGVLRLMGQQINNAFQDILTNLQNG